MNAPVKSPLVRSSRRTVSLSDKYEAESGPVYITGIQVLVRAAIQQRRLDEKAGLRTGGFVSGYRGSPLGGVDFEMTKAERWLEPKDIRFKPGVNEELGATAVWGTQKENFADYDGVFGFWYGKAPGVDRALDVLNQANKSGTSPNGGVVAFAGDDLVAKSSILPAQSEFALMHAEIPVLNPSDLQDVLDYTIHGIALSRYAGVWSSVICVADTMDSSGIVNVDPARHRIRIPDGDDPRTGMPDRPFGLLERMKYEKSLREVRLPAVQRYVRENRLNRPGFGAEKPRFAIISTGKAFRDLRQTFQSLGIGEEVARDLGIGIFKVAMPWPLEPEGITAFVSSAEKVLVVEHKRSLIEAQLKDLLYHSAGDRVPVFGKKAPDGSRFLPETAELSISDMAQALLQFAPVLAEGTGVTGCFEALKRAAVRGEGPGGSRMAYFCSGCPHSVSTKTPEGSRSAPGIGCHAMTEINGRTSEGQVAMGGEGVLWVGQSAFSGDRHIFANLGDGTYHHSGLLAIRQAVSADVNITYKILYNDAVAMTGGQPIESPMSVRSVARQLEAEGVKAVFIVSEEPARYRDRHGLPAECKVLHRDELSDVMEKCAEIEGVSAIIYDQTCAAEKRRRRKKGLMETPGRRLFINERVCEGCGDCSVQSNCISVEPVSTPYGEKRRINQSSCNMDFSCVKGFCPSFAWVEGAEIRQSKAGDETLENLVSDIPLPLTRAPERTVNLLFTGIGGTGVTTAGAVLAMAAHIDGLNASTLDMTGLAQKNGPVLSHIRMAPEGQPIEGPAAPPSGLDVLLAGDMLTAAQAGTLRFLSGKRTVAIANGDVVPTAEFVMKQTLSFEKKRLTSILKNATRETAVSDLARIAGNLLGDTVYVNMMLIGMAVQRGLIPVSPGALEKAIRLNGVAVDSNLAAFHIGRALIVKEREVLLAAGLEREPAKPETLEEKIDRYAAELTAWQNSDYAEEYRTLVSSVVRADRSSGDGSMRLSGSVARNLYKVMAYKDEYEVARLYSDRAYISELEKQFSSRKAIRVMLAPPFLPGRDKATGRPKKRAFGPWILTAFGLLARMKGLRGTAFDLFGRTRERQDERALIGIYRKDIGFILDHLGLADYGTLCALADIPDAVRGFGAVKAEKRKAAMAKRDLLLAQLDEPPTVRPFLEAAE